MKMSKTPINFHDKFPLLETERLSLTNVIQTPLEKIFEGLSDPEVIKYYGVSYTTLEACKDQMAFFENLLKDKTGIWWAIEFKISGAFVGAAGFNNWSVNQGKAEIGYWLLPAFWGKGLAFEAINAICQFGQEEMCLDRIEAIIESENTSSKKVLTKTGFLFESCTKNAEMKGDKSIDLEMFVLLNSSY